MEWSGRAPAPPAISWPGAPRRRSVSNRRFRASRRRSRSATLPQGIWPSGDGTRVYVGIENGDAVTAVDTATNRVMDTIPNGQAAQALVYVPAAAPTETAGDREPAAAGYRWRGVAPQAGCARQRPRHDRVIVRPGAHASAASGRRSVLSRPSPTCSRSRPTDMGRRSNLWRTGHRPAAWLTHGGKPRQAYPTSKSSNCWSALERSLGSTYRGDDLFGCAHDRSGRLYACQGGGDGAHDRLLPRIGPALAGCNSMACSELCRWRCATTSRQEPSRPGTQQQIDRRKRPCIFDRAQSAPIPDGLELGWNKARWGQL